jgi:hypothetical protein
MVGLIGVTWHRDDQDNHDHGRATHGAPRPAPWLSRPCTARRSGPWPPSSRPATSRSPLWKARSRPVLACIRTLRPICPSPDWGLSWADGCPQSSARTPHDGAKAARTPRYQPRHPAFAKKKVVLARTVRNNRLADALHQQAFGALSGSPGGACACYGAHRDRDIGYNAALRRLVAILHGCLKAHTRYDETIARNQPQQSAA